MERCSLVPVMPVLGNEWSDKRCSLASMTLRATRFDAQQQHNPAASLSSTAQRALLSPRCLVHFAGLRRRPLPLHSTPPACLTACLTEVDDDIGPSACV